MDSANSFKRNVGKYDRIARTTCGIGLMAFAYYGRPLLGDALAVGVVWVFSLINLATGVSGFCVVYKLAGVDTTRY